MSRQASLRQLYLTRLREFYRQPARIFWVYGFPTILAVCLGLAFNNRPPEAIQAVVVKNGASDAIKQAFEKDTQFHLQYLNATEAEHRLRTGQTPLVVERAVSGPLTYRFDPSRPDAVIARGAFDDRFQRAKGRKDSVPTVDSKVVEAGSRYIDRLIPGLIGLNTMGGGLWGVGFLIVNFRMAKLLKRFMATPMPRENFLLAILGARLTFLIPDVGVLLLLGVYGFGVPVRGNLVLFMLVEVVGALAFAGVGLLVACRARTTETVSGLMNLVMLPMWLFSGVFFPSSSFPDWMQWFIQALPLTQLLNGLRLILLEGATLTHEGVLRALGILIAWAVGTFFVALRYFRWV
jgi:ABC-type multidrug transport system permease subunit